MALKQGVCSQGQPSRGPSGSCPGQPCWEDIPYMCVDRKDTDLHPGKTKPITLKSVTFETPLIMPLLAIPEQASTLLSASSTFFFSSIILHNYKKKRKNILLKKL